MEDADSIIDELGKVIEHLILQNAKLLNDITTLEGQVNYLVCMEPCCDKRKGLNNGYKRAAQ